MGLILVRNWSVSANFGVHKLLKEVAQRMQAYLSCCTDVRSECWLRKGGEICLAPGKHAYRRVVPTLIPRDSPTLARVVRSIDDDFHLRIGRCLLISVVIYLRRHVFILLPPAIPARNIIIIIIIIIHEESDSSRP